MPLCRRHARGETDLAHLLVTLDTLELADLPSVILLLLLAFVVGVCKQAAQLHEAKLYSARSFASVRSGERRPVEWE